MRITRCHGLTNTRTFDSSHCQQDSNQCNHIERLFALATRHRPKSAQSTTEKHETLTPYYRQAMGYILPRKRILKIWIDVHQDLTEEQKQRFLNRSELDFLSQCDEHTIREAVLKSPKLSEIVQVVTELVRPAESFAHPTTNQTMYAEGKGYNDRRPRHPDAICKSCSAKLVLKENSNTSDYFWGCPNWRFDSNSCRITISVPYEEALQIIESRRLY